MIYFLRYIKNRQVNKSKHIQNKSGVGEGMEGFSRKTF